MALTPGTKLGPYEVLAPLGAGGMGEVYRARDPRLGREVAIKVLPPGLVADPDRLRRLEQEARAAAALNHPAILAVHDIGQASLGGPGDSAPFIVSELLAGMSLRERLAQGDAIPVRKAIDYAVQIAQGLAAAHDKQIVHRDLKPDNIFITEDGRAKILDFGLAKISTIEKPDGSVTDRATTLGSEPGIVLGTVGYMAPEQVRGHSADHRADIFALGCVLYEMLAGRRAFQRDSTADTMTAILKEEPPDLPVSDRRIPPALARIVDRCLEKAAGSRFQSTRDLVFALEALSNSSGSDVQAGSTSPRQTVRAWRAWIVTAAVGALAGAALAIIGMRALSLAPPVETTRFVIAPPEGWILPLQMQGTAGAGAIAVAPEGRRVAFLGQRGAETRIWVRSLDTLEAQGLAGTEGAASPFWSPDGRALAFFAGGKLKKIDLAGGPPVTLCDALPGLSGAWSPDGVILFSPAGGTALQKVSAAGGPASPGTTLSDGEGGHARPSFLPDGRHFLYRVASGTGGGSLVVGSLDSAERTALRNVDSTNVLYSMGHLLFLVERSLMAQPFDPERRILTGEPFPVAENVQTLGNPAYAFFSASPDGVLAYQTSVAPDKSQLTWLDRTGRTITTIGSPASYSDLVMSPDGKKLAVSLDQNDIWVIDLDRAGLATRFTFDAASEFTPVWAHNGSHLFYASRASNGTEVVFMQKAASGAGVAEQVLTVSFTHYLTSVSPDGRFLAYTSQSVGAGDIWMLPLTGDRKPFLFAGGPFQQQSAMFSPDGRWVAYQSFESNRSEIYVSPFSGQPGPPTSQWQVSTNGGWAPRWGPDGKELFYLSPGPDNALMVATVSGLGSAFEVGSVRRLFPVRPGGVRSIYQIAPDGKRFLVNQLPAQLETPAPLTVVINWAAGVRK